MELAKGQQKIQVGKKIRELYLDFDGVDSAPTYDSAIYSESDYQPDFCEMVICAMANGLDRQGAAGAIGCSFDTFEKWEADHKDFAKAVQIGEAKAAYFWQKQSIKHLVYSPTGKQVNSKILSLNMQARYGWGEPKEPQKKQMRMIAFELNEPPPKLEKE